MHLLLYTPSHKSPHEPIIFQTTLVFMVLPIFRTPNNKKFIIKILQIIKQLHRILIENKGSMIYSLKYFFQ